MTLANEKVVGVVAGRDLQRAAAFVALHLLVGNNRNLALQHRHQCRTPDQMPVALVLRVHCDGCIPQDGLRPRGRHRDVAAALQRIAKVIHLAWLFRMLHLKVRYGGLQPRAPVHQARPAIDQALFVKFDEDVAHRSREPVIEREALPFPVTAGAHATQLIQDFAAVAFLVGPDALEERFAANLLARAPLLRQQLLDLQLGRDSSVIRTRHPERGLALHACMANHQIFKADEERVADVQRARYVGRRDADDEGFCIRRRYFRPEPALAFPPVVETSLGFSKVEIFRHGHVGLLKQKSSRPYKDERTSPSAVPPCFPARAGRSNAITGVAGSGYAATLHSFTRATRGRQSGNLSGGLAASGPPSLARNPRQTLPVNIAGQSVAWAGTLRQLSWLRARSASMWSDRMLIATLLKPPTGTMMSA